MAQTSVMASIFSSKLPVPLKFTSLPTDIITMKISSAIVEINLPRSTGPEKIYLWPKYGQDKVDPVQQVSRRTESNIPYYKAPPAEEERILNIHRDKSLTQYSPNGTEKNLKTGIAPGSLFDALV